MASSVTNGETVETFAMKNMATMDPLKSGGEIGKRLIPQIIDAYARHEPDRIWGSQARSDDITTGFNELTFKQLAHCMDYLAWFIHHSIGPTTSFECISYIGVADLRYCPFAWAAVKCGYQVGYCLRKIILLTLIIIGRHSCPPRETANPETCLFSTSWTALNSSAPPNGSHRLNG